MQAQPPPTGKFFRARRTVPGRHEEEEEGQRNPSAASPGGGELSAALLAGIPAGILAGVPAGILAGVPAAPAEPQLPAWVGRELGRAETLLNPKQENLPAGNRGSHSRQGLPLRHRPPAHASDPPVAPVSAGTRLLVHFACPVQPGDGGCRHSRGPRETGDELGCAGVYWG